MQQTAERVSAGARGDQRGSDQTTVDLKSAVTLSSNPAIIVKSRSGTLTIPYVPNRYIPEKAGILQAGVNFLICRLAPIPLPADKHILSPRRNGRVAGGGVGD